MQDNISEYPTAEEVGEKVEMVFAPCEEVRTRVAPFLPIAPRL